MTPFIRLHPNDDVLIARAQLVGGTTVEGVTARGLIPPGHKIATRAIAPGEPVRRYNQIIGFATRAIAAGDPRALVTASEYFRALSTRSQHDATRYGSFPPICAASNKQSGGTTG